MTMNSFDYDYYNWLCGHVTSPNHPYKRLLKHLHDVYFFYTIPADANREQDGIDLVRRYNIENNLPDYYTPDHCSVLEMMIALAIRIEEQLMSDSSEGDRTGQWFWGMITNLGLAGMSDDRYDKGMVDNCLSIFLNRMYCSDGQGGLFTVKDSIYDLTEVEIWMQASWFLNDYVDRLDV